MSVTALLTLLIWIAAICLIAYVVVALLNKGGINGTVRMIVFVIAALMVLIVLLNMVGAIHVPVLDVD